MSEYFSEAGPRLSFMVGVSSPPAKEEEEHDILSEYQVTTSTQCVNLTDRKLISKLKFTFCAFLSSTGESTLLYSVFSSIGIDYLRTQGDGSPRTVV